MSEEKRAHRGCFFCKSGKERGVVQRFEALFPEGRAVAPTRSRYRRAGDTVIEERVALLPGYVFFEVAGGEGSLESPTDGSGAEELQSALLGFSRADSILKLLRYTDGGWELQGYDDRFAAMLFETGGNIGFSQACFDVGRRIRILSGFLKDYEGSIVRVNRKAKTVEINVDLQGKTVSMKLGYELVAGIDDKDIGNP